MDVPAVASFYERSELVAHRVPASVLYLSSAILRITYFHQTYTITGKGDKWLHDTRRLLSYYWLLH